MTVVDYIDLDDDECYVKVDFVDLSTDDDSVEKDGNVPEDDNVASSQNVAKSAISSSIPEQDATPTVSLSKLEQEHAATTSLSIVEHSATTSSVMAEETMHPEHQKFLATSSVPREATCSENHGHIAASDLVGEAMQSEHGEAFIFSSMTEQGGSTSLLLINQGAIASSFREGDCIQSGNQMSVTAVDCAKEATQSENIAKAAETSPITERCVMGVKGDAGNATGSAGTCILHAREEPEGDSEKNENCDFEAEPEALCQDVLSMCLPPQDNEKEISQCRKLPGRKEKKQVNISARECNKQLSIVHSNGVSLSPRLRNGDCGFSVTGNVCNGTATGSIGINLPGGEGVVPNYEGCSKTSQRHTMYGKVRDSGSEGCMVKDCTNGAHADTPLCVFHNSRPHKRCCAVIGCTKEARTSSQGHTNHCIKHGGGKRCKYDGCGKGGKGNTDYCIAHGGGRRCKFQGCRKSAQGRTDYCIEHGGGRRCTFLGCSASATNGKGLCSMHRTCMLSENNCTHERLPASAPVCRAKKAEPSKRRSSRSEIGERAQKRQNTNYYVNTRSFNVVEPTTEGKGRVFICRNNMLKAQETTHRMDSESGLAAGSPPRKLRKVEEVYT